MAGFRYSDPAKADIDKIYDDIAQHNEAAADKLIDQITDISRLLWKNPRMGADFSHIRPGLRAFPVRNYVILFRKHKRVVEIVRVVHGARDIPALFEDSDDSNGDL